VAIPYKTKDAAGLESSLGAVNIPLTGSALPLHLLSFAGSTANCTNSIMWTTAIESNMQLIELLRSEDGRQFVSIHKEQPKGMSYNQYSYADEFEGDAYYKLRMVDNDHTFEYSSTIAIKGCASSEPIQIYPSPATNQLKIEVKSTGASNYYQIMDMQGRIVMKGQLEAATVNNIDISNLSAGIYMVKVSVQSGAFSTKQIQVTK
jgi:hypothetical protein